MDYGEVLTSAWRIIWRFKILWIFGILAGCGNAAGNSGGSNSGFRENFNFNNSGTPNQFLNQAGRFIQNIPVWVWILLAAAFLVLFVITVVLSTVGQIGLVQGTVQADEGVQSLSFGKLFSSSFGYFWRVFFLNLLVGLALAVIWIAIILVVVVAGIATLGVALLCLVPLLCILIPVMVIFSWVVSIVLQQGTIAIVSENTGILDGLRRGWQVVRGNVGTFIVMALILLVGGGIVGFVIAIPMAVIVIPPLIGAFSGARNATLIGLGVAVLLFILYLPILLVATGILRAYITTAWTLTFRRLTRQTSTPAVEVIPPVEPAGLQG